MVIHNLLGPFGMGVVLGVVIGTSWEHAFELFRRAAREREARRESMSEQEYERSRDRAWITRLAILLAITSVVMMLTGGFTVYSYTKLRNFIRCQAIYNQQSAVARKARLHASDRENTTFYAWLETLPPLLAPRPNGVPPDPGQVRIFRHDLIKAVQTHQQNIDAQKAHPYPPDPKDTCGEY